MTGDLIRRLAADDNAFVVVSFATDVRSLRRIALLVVRAREDWGPCCQELEDIALAIEHMKRDVALGSPHVAVDLRRIASLVRNLSCGATDRQSLQQSVMGELRDLVAQLTP